MTAPGGFVDKRIPRRYAPFGIQNINGALFVTYARQDQAKVNDVRGAGHGFVDMFDTSGNLVARIATRGALNAPWGLALAPSDFGDFSGDLLVGNFGNGMIHAYHQETNGRWKPQGPLRGSHRKVLKIDALWALAFGNGGPADRRTRSTSLPVLAASRTRSSEASRPTAAATTTTTTVPGASPTTTTTLGGGGGGTQTHTVMVGDGGALTFAPAELTIHVGDTCAACGGAPRTAS